jgi:SOS-response transcriptional repressor LexA
MARVSRRETHTQRFGMVLKESFQEHLEAFSQRRKKDYAEIMRDGATVLMNGYLPVIGKIPCGPLVEALESTVYFEVAPPAMRPRGDLGDFLLEATGDSNFPKIESGDLVMLRPDIDFSSGELCAVRVWDDAEKVGICQSTLKRVIRKSEEEFILRAINPDYKDMIVPADCLDVVAVFRGAIKRNS